MIAGAFPVITLVLSQELINSIVKKSSPLRYTIILFTIYIIVSFLGSILGVEKTKIKSFQADMLRYFDTEHPEIGQEIEDKKVLSEELITKIVETAKEFKKSRC